MCVISPTIIGILLFLQIPLSFLEMEAINYVEFADSACIAVTLFFPKKSALIPSQQMTRIWK